jgi:drug/metabolite transporter (DMT)-like permease
LDGTAGWRIWYVEVQNKIMSAAERQHRLHVVIAFLLVYFFWGSTYIAIRIAVEHIPAAMLGATRFLTAGVLMLGYCALSGRKITLSRADAIRLAIMGVLLLTGGNVLLCYSEEYVPSGLAALIVAIVPIWVALIEGFILKGDRLRGRGWAGLALGIAGLVVLLWPDVLSALPGASGAPSNWQPMRLVAAGALLLGSLSWSVGSIISRRSNLAIGPVAATAWEMTFAGLVNLLISVGLGDLHKTTWSWRGIGATTYLIVFGSWVGFTAYIWLLEHVPTAKVATYAYVNPVVAVFLGWLILHERVDIYIAGGAVVIVAAVALVTSSKLHLATAEGETLPACEAEA